MLKAFLTASSLAATLAFTGCTAMDSVMSPHQPSKPAISLYNTPWIATEVNGTKIQLDNLNRPALSFDSTGKRFGGADGCNKIQGSFETNGQQLSLGQIAGTLMACYGDQDKVSRQFNDALAKTDRYTIKGHELSLRDKSGKTLAKFVTVIQPLP